MKFFGRAERAVAEQILAATDVFLGVVNRPERQGRVGEAMQVDREPEPLAEP
jgi:hypothetical protein